MDNSLKDYTKIVVETDEDAPKTIAVITVDDIIPADGYRIRLTPYVFVPEDSNGKRCENEEKCNNPS